jgi:asparagine synthase (glutamine-hydrolysing)
VSGIAAVLRRDGAPADEAVLRRVLDRLAHRGPDGERVAAAGPLALGHRHFWTTPEDVGEQQPISDTSGRWLAAVDGRVDNRGEVISALSLPGVEAAALSDAALLLRVFARWGTSGLARVVGSFAAAFWDSAERRLTLARDPLGDRPLCYAVTPEAVVAASEEQALLAHPASTGASTSGGWRRCSPPASSTPTPPSSPRSKRCCPATPSSSRAGAVRRSGTGRPRPECCACATTASTPRRFAPCLPRP